MSKKVLIRWCAVGFLFLVGVFGCRTFNQKFGLKNDHMVEQAFEAYIESQTGIDIDLTP